MNVQVGKTLPDGTLVPFEGHISGIKVRVIIGKCNYGHKGVEIKTYVPQIYFGLPLPGGFGTGEWKDASKGVIYQMTQVGNDKESVSVDQLDNAIRSLNSKVNQFLKVKEFLDQNENFKKLI